MQDLKHFKNDITLILSKERLDTYDSLEQYKENLKLISFITPKISSLEIYLRNALDYCLTQIKGSDWVFSEGSLTNLINEQKEKKKEITHSFLISIEKFNIKRTFMKKSNDNNALARSQRELFVGIRDFIVLKFKHMVVFNGVRDFIKMRFLSIELEKCENIKDLEKLCHTIYNQGTKHILMMRVLFLFFDYFCKHLKVKRLRLLNE